MRGGESRDVRVGWLGGERDEHATLTIRADAVSYLRIVNGELSGAEAFRTKRLAIDGDLAQAARLAVLGLM